MPRLYDRLLAQGSEPLNGRHLMSMVESDDTARERAVMTAQLDRLDVAASSTTEQIDAAIERSRAQQRAHRSSNYAVAGWRTLEKAQVIIGDEVGHYLNTFPDGIQLSTLLITPVVPPFAHVFIDLPPASCTCWCRTRGKTGFDSGRRSAFSLRRRCVRSIVRRALPRRERS